jgi:dihydrofolate reductase
MKKVIFQMSVSLDGYVEGRNREIDWHLVDDDFLNEAIETLRATSALLMGRRTYELMASYWPTAVDDDPRVAAFMNNLPKVVFSRTLAAVEWQNARLARGTVADEVARLRASGGDGPLWVGGSTLASSFLDQGLIDEIRVFVTPILLGGGNSVFADITRRHRLTLLRTRSFKSGNVLLVYHAVRE